jgi:hypothetical protein
MSIERELLQAYVLRCRYCQREEHVTGMFDADHAARMFRDKKWTSDTRGSLCPCCGEKGCVKGRECNKCPYDFHEIVVVKTGEKTEYLERPPL